MDEAHAIFDLRQTKPHRGRDLVASASNDGQGKPGSEFVPGFHQTFWEAPRSTDDAFGRRRNTMPTTTADDPVRLTEKVELQTLAAFHVLFKTTFRAEDAQTRPSAIAGGQDEWPAECPARRIRNPCS